MKGCADKKSHAALLMHSERHLDPSKPGAQLKKDEQEVEDAEHQNGRYSADVHFKNPSPLFLNGIVKNRHSRETCPLRYQSGNGNPENSNYLKILDFCLRSND